MGTWGCIFVNLHQFKVVCNSDRTDRFREYPLMNSNTRAISYHEFCIFPTIAVNRWKETFLISVKMIFSLLVATKVTHSTNTFHTGFSMSKNVKWKNVESQISWGTEVLQSVQGEFEAAKAQMRRARQMGRKSPDSLRMLRIPCCWWLSQDFFGSIPA